MTKEELLKVAKPITFNTNAISAIINGRKTTARIIIPERLLDKYYDYDDFCRAVMPPDMFCSRDYEVQFFMKHAKYHINDILYVKETYVYGDVEVGENQHGDDEPYIEQSDSGYVITKECAISNNLGTDFVKWKPSTHMTKEIARLFLRVNGVRVEQLQDINGQYRHDDILKEGYPFNMKIEQPPVLMFEKLWNSTINKHNLDTKGWNANPWVWVIEFERIKYE